MAVWQATRLGGVCGEGWEYVRKSQRTRCVQCVGRQARAQECQQKEEEGKSWNPKKTQGVDGGAVNAVRTTGSGQRVGGVCGEGWEYVWKSQRTRCVQCVGRQARAQECQQEGGKAEP